ncbi:MAG: hypothetical protein V4484_00675 [Pseudomonadota bacterium]
MSTYGRDTPTERPGPGQRAAVFAPRADAELAVAELLRNGSGMVGYGNPDGSVMVYFENNKFNDAALHSWQNKVFKAYDRMTKGSPTVNKLSCDFNNLFQIGFIQGTEILVTDMAPLTDWLSRTHTLDSAPEGSEIHA